jgi:hypothetical protein
MRNVIWCTAFCALCILLLMPGVAGAHGPRYACSSSINPTGWCARFNGDTTNSLSGTTSVDPINIVWSPYGGWSASVTGAEVQYILHYQFGWTYSCGSTQWSYRDGRSFPQEGQRAQSWCPNRRYHLRVFQGHAHQTCCYPYRSSIDDWSVSDAHHESFLEHDIDMGWDKVESLIAALARSYNHPTTAYWLFLPRANRTLQGYYSDGWATRINAYTF